jgi:hypothetical protein
MVAKGVRADMALIIKMQPPQRMLEALKNLGIGTP